MATRKEDKVKDPVIWFDRDRAFGIPTDGLYSRVDYNDMMRPAGDLEEALQNGKLNSQSMPNPIAGKTIHLPNGSVSSPSLAWANEVDSGRYRIGADSYGEATSGVLRYSWDNTEFIINDGAADYGFRIEGTGKDQLFVTDASADQVILGAATASRSAILECVDTSNPQFALQGASSSWCDMQVDATSMNFRTGTNEFHFENSTSAQEVYLHDTKSGANWERCGWYWSANVCYLAVQKNGTGTDQRLVIGNTTNADLTFMTNNTQVIEINEDGSIYPLTTGSYNIGKSDAKFLDFWISGDANIGGDINHDGTTAGFFSATPVSQVTHGADLTNNVTSGGVNDTIANFTDLSTYANDAATIRNDIYQLARSLKVIQDGLRDYGLLS